MIPQTPLCVADRNTYWVRKLFCKNELLAAMCLADRVPLMARRAKSGICRNFGAESAHSGKIALTFGLILLKNSSLIGRLFADSIALLIGRIGDDGTEAGSTGGAVL